jgi:hypothetical protein
VPFAVDASTPVNLTGLTAISNYKLDCFVAAKYRRFLLHSLLACHRATVQHLSRYRLPGPRTMTTILPGFNLGIFSTSPSAKMISFMEHGISGACACR